MKFSFLFFFLFLISAFFGEALIVEKTGCKNDGSFFIDLKAENKTPIYTSNITIRSGDAVLTGEWSSLYIKKSETSSREYATFTSEEDLLVEKKRYPLSIDYYLGDEQKSAESYVDCPGLVFTCKRLGIEIERCYTMNNEFNAYLVIKGLEQSEQSVMDPKAVVSYQLEVSGRYLDIDGIRTSKGSLPLGYRLTKDTKDRYFLSHSFEDNYVKKLWVGYNTEMPWSCSKDDYPEIAFYDYKECTIKKAEDVAEAEKAVTEEQTKVDDIKPVSETSALEKTEEMLPGKKSNQLLTLVIALAVVCVISFLILDSLKKRGLT